MRLLYADIPDETFATKLLSHLCGQLAKALLVNLPLNLLLPFCLIDDIQLGAAPCFKTGCVPVWSKEVGTLLVLPHKHNI